MASLEKLVDLVYRQGKPFEMERAHEARRRTSVNEPYGAFLCAFPSGFCSYDQIQPYCIPPGASNL